MTHDEFNARFVWTGDSRFWDSWRLLKGPMTGDCDDYAVTSLHIACGGWAGFWWSLITFRAGFWYTRIKPGKPLHMMVWRKGLGWVDNANPEWGPRSLPRLFPMPWPLVAMKIAMGALK